MTVDQELERLHVDLNWKRLSKFWAKLEIMLGLAGFVGGLLIAEVPDMINSLNPGPVVLGGAILATLGGYLALAGHRSHLYQSHVKLAAWIVHVRSNGPETQFPESQTLHATNCPNLSGPHDS